MKRNDFIKAIVVGAIALAIPIKTYPKSFKITSELLLALDHNAFWKLINKKLGPDVEKIQMGYEGDDFYYNKVTIAAI